MEEVLRVVELGERYTLKMSAKVAIMGTVQEGGKYREKDATS